jgi:hypothetical protein
MFLNLDIQWQLGLLGVINVFIVIMIIAVTYWVARDTRKRGLSWFDSIFWAVVTLVVILPIGWGLYMLIGRPKVPKNV